MNPLTSFPGTAYRWLSIHPEKSTITFTHHEIERTENRHRIADHVTGQEEGQNAQVHKRGRANLQAMGRAAAFAVDIEPKFALRVFVAEVHFAGRGIHTLSDQD